MGRLIKLALALGVGSGALEVALRAQPRLGMSWSGLLSWAGLNIALSVLYLLVAAVVAHKINRRSHGLLVSALIVVHAALFYRFEIVLNEFIYDPKVWGGLLGIGLASLLFGLLVLAWLWF